MDRIIAFLGNPGPLYQTTRHNFGRMAGRALCKRLPELEWKKKFKADTALVRLVPPGSGILLLYPSGFMNTCGEAVAAAASFYTLSPRQIIAVHDDLELPFGKTALREGGGLGGHNGLRSIADRLGSRDFARIRLGIGRPSRGSPASFVLARFTPEEEVELPVIIGKAVDLLMNVISGCPS